MKILSYILVVFSSLAVIGLIFDVSSDPDKMWGVVYAGAVIVQGCLIIDHLNKEHSN